MQDEPSGGNVRKALPAAPDDGDARWAVAATCEIAAESGNPEDSIGDRWYLCWREGGLMGIGVQGLPFGRGQDGGTRRLWVVTCNVGHPHEAPGNNAVEGEQGEQTLNLGELRPLYLTAGLEDLVVDFDFPALAVPLNACLLYTSPSPRDRTRSRMPSSA